MRLISIIFALLLLFPFNGFSGSTEDLHKISKPAAPPELTEMLHHFSELEESFEDKEWDNANQHFEIANALLGKILQNLRRHTSREDLTSFRIKFMDLKDKLRARHLEFVEEGFVDMQKAFFVLTDYFSFKTPLFLDTVGKYIKEAEEALEKKDWDDVSSEMNEISEFIESFDEDLSKHGIKNEEIEEFIILAFRVKRAAKSKNIEKVKTGIDRLENMYEKFISAYQ